jgi:hypothetical protein
MRMAPFGRVGETAGFLDGLKTVCRLADNFHIAALS